MGSRILYRNTGVVLMRASTDPGGLELPDGIDLDGDAVIESGRAWLAQLCRREEVRAALWVASPSLSEQIDAMLGGGRLDARQMRSVLVSTWSYVLRWRRRPTPFGLFAGVAAASTAGEPTARFGQCHRVAARADAQWLGGLIDDLERHPGVLLRLTVVVNNAGFTRGDRFVVPARPDEAQPGRAAALDFSVRSTRAVRAALAGAAEPIRVAALAQRIGEQFPRASSDEIYSLLAELVASRVLITSLRAPMTTVDALAHVITQLEAVGAEGLPDIADLRTQLAAIHDELSHPSLGVFPSDIGPALEGVAKRMRAVHDRAEKVLAVDVALGGQLTVPDAVMCEAEAAATALLRLTPYPFGLPEWRDFHARCVDRYGTGAVIPVRDILADSGLGFPAGFPGAPRPPAPRALTERDGTLLGLIQQAAVDGRDEIELTEPVIRALTVGDHAQMIRPSRVELAFQLHAASRDAVARGRFQLWVTGAPGYANSMAGRFAYLLSEADRRRLADTYTPTCDHAVAAQLSFPPRREHNENITRTPQLLPRVISLAEHRADDDTMILLDDLAVTVDAARMYLVRMSTGDRVQPHVLHALETTAQTPPLARFLAEVASARCGAYGPFDYGPAREMPFLPRVRYGRSVLAPARWLLNAADLPPIQSATSAWEKALSAWRDRWRVPSGVVLCEGELRLPLDMDNRLHWMLLRARLDRNRTGRVELRETGDQDALAWAGRPCELLVPLTLTHAQPAGDRPRTALRATVTRGDALLPGNSAVLRAQLLGHSLRFDEILTDHLSLLLDDVEDHVVLWWFRRHHDATRPDGDQHLVLCLRLRGSEEYGDAAARLADWAAGLRACGLLADLDLGTYQPWRGAYGHGTALEAAVEGVFAADSAAALAQIRLATDTGMPKQAIAAASMSDVAAFFAATPQAGHRWLVDLLPQEHGKLGSSLREATLRLASVDDWAQLRGLPGGRTVANAWDQRREALAVYRDQLSQDNDRTTLLRTLLHDHHVRAVGADPGVERVTNRLARTVAQRQIALIKRDAP